MAYHKWFFAPLLFLFLANFAHAGVVFGPAYGTPNSFDDNFDATFTDGSSISFSSVGVTWCHSSYTYYGYGSDFSQTVCHDAGGNVQFVAPDGSIWTGTVTHGFEVSWWGDGPGFYLTDDQLTLDFTGLWNGQPVRGVFSSETGTYAGEWAQLSAVTTPEPTSSALLLVGLPTIFGYWRRQHRMKQ